MRIYHLPAFSDTRPPTAPTSSDADARAIEQRPTEVLPSHTLVFRSADPQPQTRPSSRTVGDDGTQKRLIAERDRARAQRDAALEEVVLLREEIRGWETHHTALVEQAIAKERWELKSLLGALAIMQEELARKLGHETPPKESAHAARK